MRLARAIACVAATLGLGCAPVYGEAYVDAMAKASRAYHAGRYVEASQGYDDAAKKALRVKDRDEALFLEARTLERAERWADAKRTYERIVAVSPKGPRAERAAFDVADLEIAHGDVERGFALLEKAMLDHPTFGLAHTSLVRLVDRAKERGGSQAALAWLDQRARVLSAGELDQTFQYARAGLLVELGRKQEAHDQYVAAATKHPYPFGELTDDALFHAAELDEEAKPLEAIEHLRAMLALREPADTMGSYERPRYSAAQRKIADLYLERLHDHASARRELHKLYTDFTTSTLRDDALWDEARIARQDGDERAACDRVATLVKDFPDSRYASCAQLLCPSAAPGKKECAEYIKRQIDDRTEHSPSGG